MMETETVTLKRKLDEIPFIPQPVSVSVKNYNNNDDDDSNYLYFSFSEMTKIYVQAENKNTIDIQESMERVSRYFHRHVLGNPNITTSDTTTQQNEPSSYFHNYDNNSNTVDSNSNYIMMTLISPLNSCCHTSTHIFDKEEGYQIEIDVHSINIYSTTTHGLINAMQTFRQLLSPPHTTPHTHTNNSISMFSYQIPCGSILDYPHYTFRSTMIDVARHFFSVQQIKRHIDIIAQFKINILHLHLSDDQGWRIEIKSWPKLTLIGSQSYVRTTNPTTDAAERGGGGGGFYTQAEFLDIVHYATLHHIIIIPEIDVPGHTNAALASYAELNSDYIPKELYFGTDVGFSTLCTSASHNHIVMKFIQDVIRELVSITPGPYIHIGGDESYVTPNDEYKSFIQQVHKIVSSYGKIMIGWEDILQCSSILNYDNTLIQIWKPARAENHQDSTIGYHNSHPIMDNNNSFDTHHDKINDPIEILKQNKSHKFILSPADKIYLDMKYDNSTQLGLNWAGYIPVNIAYDWDLERYIPDIHESNILGVEAPLWTESITNSDEIDYMVFPRLIGVAELAWSSPLNRQDWDDYKVRLGKFKPRLDSMNINFYQSPDVPWVPS